MSYYNLWADNLRINVLNTLSSLKTILFFHTDAQCIQLILIIGVCLAHPFRPHRLDQTCSISPEVFEQISDTYTSSK